MSKLRITLKKSPIGYKDDQRATIRALGLYRLHHTVEKDNTADIRGMVHKVRHLVEVKEA
jgi:large subunit ribosomal protein L30